MGIRAATFRFGDRRPAEARSNGRGRTLDSSLGGGGAVAIGKPQGMPKSARVAGRRFPSRPTAPRPIRLRFARGDARRAVATPRSAGAEPSRAERVPLPTVDLPPASRRTRLVVAGSVPHDGAAVEPAGAATAPATSAQVPSAGRTHPPATHARQRARVVSSAAQPRMSRVTSLRFRSAAEPLVTRRRSLAAGGSQVSWGRSRDGTAPFYGPESCSGGGSRSRNRVARFPTASSQGSTCRRRDHSESPTTPDHRRR